MTRAIRDLLSIRWADEGLALIEPPWPSPIVADPSFLFPEETPDGSWALACHDAFGLLLYESADGLSWSRPRRIAFNGMRGFLRKVDSSYLLWYEAYRPLGIAMTVLPRPPRWKSRISLMESDDLFRWSSPRSLLMPGPDWTAAKGLGRSVSNPCAVEVGQGRWRLYCSAGLAFVPDCGFTEPRHLALAEGTEPRGPFALRDAPIKVEYAEPPSSGEKARDGPPEIGAGSMKAIRCSDGWVGFQNLIARGPGGKSRSFIRLLSSVDGIAWTVAQGKPLLEPSSGWRSSHVYACDVRFREADGRWYLYYNARDGWYKTQGRERIGRLVGISG